MITNDVNILTAKNDYVSIDEATDLVKQLEDELHVSATMGRPGIGLACPQIGINKKVAIVRIDNSSSYNLSVNLANAKIEKAYDPFLFKKEGCLSFGDEVFDTMRYKEIYVVNNLFEPHSFVATGLMAVAIQHELDHLDGILFHDRKVITKTKAKQKPNDPCLCGAFDALTGKIKKYKKCCGRY